jgi:hypothetical protein
MILTRRRLSDAYLLALLLLHIRFPKSSLNALGSRETDNHYQAIRTSILFISFCFLVTDHQTHNQLVGINDHTYWVLAWCCKSIPFAQVAPGACDRHHGPLRLGDVYLLSRARSRREPRARY